MFYYVENGRKKGPIKPLSKDSDHSDTDILEVGNNCYVVPAGAFIEQITSDGVIQELETIWRPRLLAPEINKAYRHQVNSQGTVVFRKK